MLIRSWERCGQVVGGRFKRDTGDQVEESKGPERRRCPDSRLDHLNGHTFLGNSKSSESPKNFEDMD